MDIFSKKSRFYNVKLPVYLAALAISALPVSVMAQPAPGAPPAPSTPTAPNALTNVHRFAALEAVTYISLSPDGANIAFITPGAGQSADLFVVGTAEGSVPRRALHSSGNPEHLSDCRWATNERIVCRIVSRVRAEGRILSSSNIISVDATGGNLVMLSRRHDRNSGYFDFRGGAVIDWMPQSPGSVLMTRSYTQSSATGANISRNDEGIGVDLVDVTTGTARQVERPRQDVFHYLTDGNGNLRIMANRDWDPDAGRLSGVVRYFYRPAAGGRWEPLTTYDLLSEEGLSIVAVDAANNRAIGFAKVDGRQAVVSLALDGSGTRTTVFAHPQVDVDEVITIGRNQRVVGATFATDRRQAVMTDTRLQAMTTSLSRALGGKNIYIVNTTADESQFLFWAGSDVSPGQYYLYTPAQRQLRPLLANRPQMAAVTLSPVQSITYSAADGTMIPAYLTLPPGRTDARGLPAIVMPHGGPSSRDEWGFDWLSQYFAQTGYAVIQPNFRGSSGYGDAWYMNNGFQSWRTSVGDVTDAGRWLVSAQGVDPAKLSIVGWSYGGYAALQAGVLAPDLFKSIVAIAPVTDLAQMRQSALNDATAHLQRAFIGTGPHLTEGSPARNAATITAPVLMFHGNNDQNVDIEQGRIMQRAMQQAGHRSELIEYDDLGHSLGTSEARQDMLTRISAFLPH